MDADGADGVFAVPADHEVMLDASALPCKVLAQPTPLRGLVVIRGRQAAFVCSFAAEFKDAASVVFGGVPKTDAATARS
jgi:hypothetical protein